MNYTRIEKDFYFHAGLHFENSFYINTYDITISLLVETESAYEQSIAMDRAIYFIDNVLKDSILVSGDDHLAIKKYQNAGLRICELPNEPYDQIVGMIVLQKLNAIMENKLKITDLVIASVMSEGVRYSLVSEVSENVLSGNYWWNKADTNLCNTNAAQPDNVVKLFGSDEWAELGLAWKEKAN